MTNIGDATTPEVRDGEKLTPIMVYTQNLLAWGQVVTVEAIRVSTILRTQSKPTYLNLRSAQVMDVSTEKPSKPQFYDELLLPTSQVIGFHIKPPDQDPLDYDPNEENRIMAPVKIMVGRFRFMAKIRMSSQTTLARYMDVSKLEFTSIYEVSIKNLLIPALGVIRVPFALVRSESVLFSPIL